MLLLSDKTKIALASHFSGADYEYAALLLIEECGNNLPFNKAATPKGLERIRFAAIKLSKGSIQKLNGAVELAKADWRDLLLCAGFGDIDAHDIR